MRFIHISDIHFGHGPQSHRNDQEMVINRLVDDIARIAKRDGPPDWLFLTGDVAFSGGALSNHAFDEYSVATERITRLTAVAGIDLQHVLVIPGNHDVDRRFAGASRAKTAVNESVRGDSNALDAVLANQEDRQILLGKLARFDTFASHLGPPHLRKIPRDVTWSVEPTSNHAIVGLNTALASGPNDHPAALCLGTSQIVVIDRIPADRLVIVLAHHPPNWLADGQQLRTKLQRRQHLLLTGHEHDQNLFQSIAVGGGRLVHLTAGAAHDESGQPGRHTYAWGELRVEELIYWPRVWNRNQDGFVAAREDVPTLDSNESISIPLSAKLSTEADAQSIDLRKTYCRQVVERLEAHNSFLSGEYLPLRSIDPAKGSSEVADSLSVVLGTPDAPDRLGFLGDFGCGKTCLAQQIVLRSAREYLLDGTKRLPLLLRLARSREYKSSLAFVVAEVQHYLRKTDADAEGLIAEGGFLFVFDGLDEMPRDASLPELRRCLFFLEDIHQLGFQANRSVLTSRTTFFKSQVEEGRLRDFHVRYILPWGDSEWQRCLDTAGLGQIKDALDRIYSVADLVRKPFFVKLIVENHQAIVSLGQRQGKITSTDLYKLYVDRLLADQVMKPTSVLDEREKRQMLHAIALKMFFAADTKLSVDTVATLVAENFAADTRQQADVVVDVLNNTLFNRVMQDFVAFPHKSVMEYLVAENLSEECKRGVFDNYKQRFFYTELYIFCALLQADQAHVDSLFAELNRSRDQYFVPNALVILRVLRMFFKFDQEERLTHVLLRNLASYAPEDLTARYSSAFSFWRCPFTPELPTKLLELYKQEPFGLIRRILWLTLEYYRDAFHLELALPKDGMNDTFAPEFAQETFALHPSGVEALLVVNLQGDMADEGISYWIVQVGTSLFLSSAGEVRLLPAMLRDLSSPTRQLRENAVICLHNLLRHDDIHDHVQERLRAFLAEEGSNLDNNVKGELASYVS